MSVAAPLSFDKLKIQEEDDMFEDDDYEIPEDYDEEMIEKQAQKLQVRKISEKRKLGSFQSNEFLSKLEALEKEFSSTTGQE